MSAAEDDTMIEEFLDCTGKKRHEDDEDGPILIADDRTITCGHLRPQPGPPPAHRPCA